MATTTKPAIKTVGTASKTADLAVGAKATTFLQALATRDVQFALLAIAFIAPMFLPLPVFLLDFGLSISIAMSFLILIISMYLREPLDFSSFPTVLLMTTIFRLSLNVATTRSILSNGATGDVSEVVQAFGRIVVGGDYFVGAVLFAIVLVINFIVITKGAGRVAEVSARFTLDAMPGKQMAIDAELSNGLIDRDEAKRRRFKVERESEYYGTMDGASKFVRGDAIAALIITGVNIAVGLGLGVFRYNMTFAQAAQTFTLLTVGEGLVSQIPALIISIAAGIVITRAASEGGLGDEVVSQVIVHPRAMYICCGITALLAIFFFMRIPMIPFTGLSVGFFYLGRFATREVNRREAEGAAATEAKNRPLIDENSVEHVLRLETLSLEVGVDLVALVDTAQDGEVLARIVSLRKQLAQEFGIIVPMVMIRDNIQLRSEEYQFLLKGNVIGKGRLYPRRYLAMDPGDVMDAVQGQKTKEPAYGLDAIWITANQREEATFKGYTVVNCATVVVTHLQKLLEDHAHELLGRQEVHQLIEGLKAEHPKVVEEVIGADKLALGDVVKVLQNLLAEGVSIRDLLSIFESLADNCRTLRHPDLLTRYVRKALGRGILKKYITPDNKLHFLSLDRAVEDLLASSLVENKEDNTYSARFPIEIVQRLINNIATAMQNFSKTGTQPIIVCGPMIRWEFRQMIARFVPGLVVIASDEIPASIITEPVGQVSI